MSEKFDNVHPSERGLVSSSFFKTEKDLVDNQNYLSTNSVKPFCLEWNSIHEMSNMALKLPAQSAFGVKLSLRYASFIDPADDLNKASFYMGIKNPKGHYKDGVEFGLYLGRLYFNKIFDTVDLQKEDLIQGIYLLLTVMPDEGDDSTVSLAALDQSGLESAKMNIGKMLYSDWNGKVSTGAHIKSVCIEGFMPKF